MTDEIAIPTGGSYIRRDGHVWHIKITGGVVSLRLVDRPIEFSGSLSLTMPAGNVVEIQAAKDRPHD